MKHFLALNNSKDLVREILWVFKQRREKVTDIGQGLPNIVTELNLFYYQMQISIYCEHKYLFYFLIKAFVVRKYIS